MSKLSYGFYLAMSSITSSDDGELNWGRKIMKHIQDKNDWLSYEFKPYFFFAIGLLGMILKKNLTLSTSQNVVAYLSISMMFVGGAMILYWRNDYRQRTSRK
jgi:hypothetical protein